MELERKILTTSMSALAVVAVLGIGPIDVQAQQATHTVEAGEYLYNIAPQYDVTVDELIEWNNLSSNDLQIGDQLIVQSPNEEKTAEETSSEITQETTYKKTDNTVDETQTVQPSSENGHYYVVKPGDYLYKIANRFGMTTEDLIEANNLVSNNLQIGDILFIPSDSVEDDDEDNGNEETPSETYYTVQAGDYLYKIAQQFGTTVEAIKDANDLTNNNLQIGDVLLIPDGSEEDADDDEETPSETYYTVQAGDYLYKIAQQFGTTVEAIKEANDLTNNNLQIGDVLLIPDGSEEDDDDDEETPSETYYTVQAGDYLYKIAQQFGTTVEAIKEANDLTNNNLQIGDVLIIPEGSKEDDDDDEETPSETYYIVQAGDYLYKIAQQFGTTVEAIKYANDLTNNNLQIGDVLIIPNGSEEVDDDEEIPSETYYTVQAGDYLYKIAQQFGTTVEAIKQANDLTNNNLQIGDVLLIPEGSEEDNDDDEETPSETYYTVQAGDYLYKIAQQFGTTVEAIKYANDLTNNNLQIGDVLLIPNGSEEDPETPEFVAPKPGDLAYMPGMTLVEKYFPTVNSAVTYAEKNFDYNEHINYFVNYFKGSFVLYFQPK
ncbi:LysM peptidoglycan-binding domain-containing protein [Aerococcaceae bacterium INB8]|uniref:LysM peptidoglycan-binding domain-containing protein n=1 Tax=Ruoffia halotolerans TaxID=2748684 RepID=A0A839A326_9LACT|nr:LysM peptidoglycan-binding domain-containing protein [Ruoffia halotolerans]MBA5728260.1 LysM peptidoglycan-binding domain-containing protein [Ruoffia halotolerans]